MLEELRFDVTIGSLFAAFTYINEIKGSHSIELLYFAQAKEGSEPTINPEDHSGLLWVNEDNINLVEQENGSDDQELPYLKKSLRILNNYESIKFG